MAFSLIDNPVIGYNYDMGFQINGTPIPDPAAFSGKTSDLDTLGKRNAHGTLKRNLVATKTPIKIEYNAIEWEMMQAILQLMMTTDAEGKAISKSKFTIKCPDPGSAGGTVARTCYVGDREWDCTTVLHNIQVGGEIRKQVYVGSLKFSLIEI